MQSRIYLGSVRHDRLNPKPHQFTYQVAYFGLFIDELPKINNISKLFQIERFAPISFRSKNYINENTSIEDWVARKLKEKDISVNFNRVMLLTHPSYFGYCYNPVSFYFCFQNEQITAILSEINNTPWNERHIYAFLYNKDNLLQTFKFSKEFHISPFMPMNIDYDWKFKINEQKINIFMQNFQKRKQMFKVGMSLNANEFNHKNILKALTNFPLQTYKVHAAIYWQAFLLWCKRNPFYSHPSKV